jgi:hypothetical protein
MRLSRLGRNCRNSDHAKRLARGTGLSGRHSQPRPAARFSLRHKASFLVRHVSKQKTPKAELRASNATFSIHPLAGRSVRAAPTACMSVSPVDPLR